MPLGTGHPDIEEASLLGDCSRRLRELGGQFALLEPREEDSLEFESFRAVIGQEVNSPSFTARAETLLEVRDELSHSLRPVVELRRESDEARKILLARDLAVAEPIRDPVEEPLV